MKIGSPIPHFVLASLFSLCFLPLARPEGPRGVIEAHWDWTIIDSKTILSIQVCVEPPLRRASPMVTLSKLSQAQHDFWLCLRMEIKENLQDRENRQ